MTAPGRPAAQPEPLPPSRSSWWRHAACLGHRHPDWFTSSCYRANTKTDELTVNARRAIVVCAGCGARSACLAEALMFTTQVGIWGGLTDRERALPELERAVILRERFGSA